MEISAEQRKELIMKERPNLKENSVKQYISHLNKLTKLFDSPDNYEFLKDPDSVMDKIKDTHYTSQRNTLNAIIVLLMALNSEKEYDELLKTYGKLRDNFNLKYEKEQESGKISEKQKDNFVELGEIDNMLLDMEFEIKKEKLKKKENLSGKEKELLMVYTLFNFLKRIPTRNDMAGQKYITYAMYRRLSDEDKKNNNYLVKKKEEMFGVYNEYKTSSKYGLEKKITIPKDLERILNMYIRTTGKKAGDYLFVNSVGTPLNRNQISQLLLKTSQKYLKKNISTTMMRKIVASHHYNDKKFIEMKEAQKELAHNMGHSVAVQDKVYIKSNDD
jgi:integrase